MKTGKIVGFMILLKNVVHDVSFVRFATHLSCFLNLSTSHYDCVNFVDFGSSNRCNRRDLMALKYYADDKQCGTKAMSVFRALEDRFDSLDECCRAKFPLAISDCCEAGDGGCALTGSFKYIPVSDSYIGLLGFNIWHAENVANTIDLSTELERSSVL